MYSIDLKVSVLFYKPADPHLSLRSDSMLKGPKK
jgi:hypothetical protein